MRRDRRPFFANAVLTGLLALLAACATPAATRAPAPAAKTQAQSLDATPNTAAPAPVAKPPAPVAEPPASAATGPLVIDFLDVGQGDSALVRTPAGRSLLIDVGPRKAGKRVVDWLQRAGITRLDFLVLTHPHADHIGGALALLDAVEVAVILDPGFAHTTQSYARLLARIEALADAGKTRYVVASRGRKLDLGEGVQAAVLGPPEQHFTGTRSDANSNSVVLRLSHGEVDVLLTGDAEPATQSWLLSKGDPIDAEVLKVAHHGSRHGTSAPFLAAVAPQIAVISCGRKNRYGHPHPDTLARLAERGVKVLRTDESGTVRVLSDGEQAHIVREPTPQLPAAQTHARHGT